MNLLGKFDDWVFDPQNDGIWDLLVLPASAVSLLCPKSRLYGALGLALWASRAVAVHGGKSNEPGSATSS